MEVNLWDQLILVNDILKLTVGQKDQLFRSRVDLLRHICLLCRVRGLWTRLTLTQDLGQFLDAICRLNRLHNAIALLDQVVDDLLEKSHA